jgi:hypothetical protein
MPGVQDWQECGMGSVPLPIFSNARKPLVAMPSHIPAIPAKSKFAREINWLRCGIVENTILQVYCTILQVWAE